MENSNDLRTRAQKFLAREYPLGNYAADNLTDGFINRYIDGGPWHDPELPDLLALCYLEARSAVEDYTGEPRSYFEECVGVLRAILADVYPDRLRQLEEDSARLKASDWGSLFRPPES